MLKAKPGISPICWWNDDLVELSDDVSPEECLRQASRAGYPGWRPADAAVRGDGRASRSGRFAMPLIINGFIFFVQV